MKKILEFCNQESAARELWLVDDVAWKALATRKLYPIALMLSLCPKNPKSALASWRLERLSDKLDRFAKKGRRPCALWVAKCYFADTIELYFYCPDKQAASDLTHIASKKFVEIKTNLYGDPDWVIFKTELYPSPTQLQTIKNIDLVALYEKRGDNLKSPRRVNHYCCFKDEVSMLGYFEQARRGGFAIGETYFTPEHRLPHSCCVRHISTIDKPAMDAATARIIAIAQPFDGEYVQWDCAIMNARRY